MRVKLSKIAPLGGRKVRVVAFRQLSVADLKSLAEASEQAVAAPDHGAAAMVSIATGIPAAEVLALPVDDFAALVEATVALAEAAADRLGRLSFSVSAAGSVH